MMTRNVLAEIEEFTRQAGELEAKRNELIASIEAQLSTVTKEEYSENEDSLHDAYFELLYTIGADYEYDTRWRGGECEIWMPSTC